MVSALITSYGYLAVFVGTLLEGETVLITAGFAAHRGLLDLPVVILVAIAGSTLGDQLAFLLGRWKGNALIARIPALAQHKGRIHDLLDRHDLIFILGVRFLYGLRIAGPLIIGSSRVPPLRFAVLNLLGATVWSTLVSGVGYSLGIAASSFISNLRGLEEIILACFLVAGSLFWLWRQFFGRQGTDQR